MHHLYRRLEPYGLKLADVRVERDAGNVADQHLLLYLFNYLMTVRIRVERIEVDCSELPEDVVEKLQSTTWPLPWTRGHPSALAAWASARPVPIAMTVIEPIRPVCSGPRAG